MKTAVPDFETEPLVIPARPAHDSPKQSITMLALPGIVLTLACLVPFLNKAYTIDDPAFLLEARQILQTPLQPMSYPICWLGNETCVARVGSLGPGSAQALMGYLLVPVVLLGGAERIAHLLQIVLACLAITGMVRLSLRLGFDRSQAAIAGLLVAAIPPFLSMASTAMPDIAALALGLTGIERLLAWKDERCWHQAAIASLALGLAPWARLHTVLLIPLGALWLLLAYTRKTGHMRDAAGSRVPSTVWQHRTAPSALPDIRFRSALAYLRREAALWMPIFVAAGILLLVNWLTRDRGPSSEPRDILAGTRHIPWNLYAYLRYLAFPIPFAAVWIAAHFRRARIVFAAPSLALAFVLLLSRNLALSWQIASALWALVALVHMVLHYIHARDRVGTLLSLWVLIPAPIVIYAHFPIKYMTAVLPAIVLILIRTISRLQRSHAFAAYGALILAGAGYSSLLLRADADFAEYGRRAAAELVAPYVAAGEKVWYGGQWGFYWYAQEAGARISRPGHPGPEPGELLAVGLEEGGNVTRDRFPNRKLIASRHYGSPHGRTMGYGAGLYSNGLGDFLWVWNPEATNVYELWRVY